ncbi:hypothetical protein AUJ46_04345 [Candidatus Peregrinibacteria bacterium CG1_02_54_53]|nr:MAG: hypothetical protein AUJ46_04345 [Candidatus Peregrinibacteria bacterium CG1_02_54_53]
MKARSAGWLQTGPSAGRRSPEGSATTEGRGHGRETVGCPPMNTKVVQSIEQTVEEGLTPEALAKGVTLQVGKRKFARIVH